MFAATTTAAALPAHAQVPDRSIPTFVRMTQQLNEVFGRG